MQAHTAIGVISPQLSALYFGMLLQGIRAVAEQRGLRVVAIQSTPAQVAAAQLAVDYVTGWIVINDLTGIEQLTTLGAPVVTIGAVATDQAIPAILPDNQGGMHEAITHLIEHGHQRIAFAGDMRQLDMQQRYAGYLSAHTAAGLTTDPALLLDLDSNSIIMGTALARRLCDGELDCTALATATDELALGLLTALDQDKTNAPPLAVVGFDDILPAQFTRPPLTTVHVSVDLIGRIAAEQVLAETSPGQLPEQIVTVPTSLVRRQSCGCALQTPSEAAPDKQTTSRWLDQLGRHLASMVVPDALAIAQPLEAIWPAGALLCHGLEAAVEGRQLPSEEDILLACQEIVATRDDLDTLLQIAYECDRAAISQIDLRSDRVEANQRVSDYLEMLRRFLMGACMSRLAGLHETTLMIADQSQRMSIRLLTEDAEAIYSLSWLEHSSTYAGCLGLWEQPRSTNRLLSVVGSYQHEAPPASAQHMTRSDSRSFPPATFLERLPGQSIALLLPIATADQEWGVLALGGMIMEMLSRTNYDTLSVFTTVLGLSLRRLALQERLLVSNQREQELALQVRELSCPVIPLLKGVLLVPLIGVIDQHRLSEIITLVLQSISEQQAQTILLDVSGVPIVDTQVASGLVQIARAASLLGSHVWLVGIRPEIAQSMVGLGIDLGQIRTTSTMAAAIRTILATPAVRSA